MTLNVVSASVTCPNEPQSEDVSELCVVGIYPIRYFIQPAVCRLPSAVCPIPRCVCRCRHKGALWSPIESLVKTHTPGHFISDGMIDERPERAESAPHAARDTGISLPPFEEEAPQSEEQRELFARGEELRRCSSTRWTALRAALMSSSSRRAYKVVTAKSESLTRRSLESS